MTYGDIAELLGRGGARGVGTVMARYGSDVPWWRVIRAGGGLPQGLEDEALAHYREEGTPLVGGQLAGTPGGPDRAHVGRGRRVPGRACRAPTVSAPDDGIGRVLTLRRAPSLVVGAPPLDEQQQAAVEHRGGVLRVLGAPGHRQDHDGRRGRCRPGRVRRARAGRVPAAHVVAAGGRRACASAVTARLARTSTEPLARTHQSFGVRRPAAGGRPARATRPPRLLSGPEQDVILRDLLAGHAAVATAAARRGRSGSSRRSRPGASEGSCATC